MVASGGAIRAGRAFVEFFADDSQLQGTLRSIETRIGQFGRQLSSLGTRLIQTATLLSIPFAAAARIFGEFEDEFQKIIAITGQSESELASLEETMRELGRSTSFTARQIASAGVELARLGFSGRQIEGLTGNVLNLARATSSDLALAAQLTGTTMRAFGLDVSDTERIVDVLTKTVNASSQTIEELGEAMKFVAPFAKATNTSLEETAAALGVLANAGVRATIGGTSLRRILIGLSDRKLDEEFRRIGVNVEDAQGNLRDFGQIMRETFNSLREVGSRERTSFFADVFGIRGAVGANVVTSMVDQFDILLAQLERAGGTARQTADTMERTLFGTFRRMISATESLAIAIGDQLKPVLEDILNIIRNLSNIVSRLAETNPGVVPALAQGLIALAGAGAGLIVVGKSITLIASVAGGLATLVGTISGVVGLINPFTVGLVAAGVAIFKIAQAAYEAVGGLEGLKTIIQQLRIPELLNALLGFGKAILNLWGAIWNANKEFLKSVIELAMELKRAFGGVVMVQTLIWLETIKALTVAINTLAGVLNDLTESSSKWTLSVKSQIDTITEYIQSMNGFEAVSKDAEEAGELSFGKLGDAIESFAKRATKIWQELTKEFEKPLTPAAGELFPGDFIGPLPFGARSVAAANPSDLTDIFNNLALPRRVDKLPITETRELNKNLLAELKDTGINFLTIWRDNAQKQANALNRQVEDTFGAGGTFAARAGFGLGASGGVADKMLETQQAQLRIQESMEGILNQILSKPGFRAL